MIDQQSVLHATCLLQPLPASVHRLSALAFQPEPDLAEMVDAIGYDPVLTTRLLRVANSALYRCRSDVRTSKEAVMRIGTGMVLGLAIGASARPLVAATVPGYGIRCDDFWRHSVTAALVGEVGRSFTKNRWSPAGFTAALLHDFGKLVLGHFLNPEHLACLAAAQADRDLEPFQAEQEMLGIHHARVGAFVAKHWELPDEIVDGILYHHDPGNGTGALPAVTCFANLIAKAITAQTDQSVLDSPLLRSMLDRLGIAATDVPRICTNVMSRFDELNALYN